MVTFPESSSAFSLTQVLQLPEEFESLDAPSVRNADFCLELVHTCALITAWHLNMTLLC